ncbi:hypothetical protein [Marinilactibacillus kalidii]|uniref:hypothetical protein n=1 Tax=Marinilactibacillus kalidii TaxID=2820274 RepID=UPI001ABE1422|nr:hypothetical protein [Marinilactibacillus kalidii]
MQSQYNVVKKNDKWIATHKVDTKVIKEFDSEQTIASFLAMEHIYVEKLHAIKLLMNPSENTIINDQAKPNEESSLEFVMFLSSIAGDTTFKKYYAKIDKKLNELLVLR